MQCDQASADMVTERNTGSSSSVVLSAVCPIFGILPNISHKPEQQRRPVQSILDKQRHERLTKICYPISAARASLKNQVSSDFIPHSLTFVFNVLAHRLPDLYQMSCVYI